MAAHQSDSVMAHGESAFATKPADPDRPHVNVVEMHAAPSRLYRSGEVRRICYTYYSVEELIAVAEKWAATHPGLVQTRTGRDFTGVEKGRKGFDRACELARIGWKRESESLELADATVRQIFDEKLVETFRPVWDVSGAEVDVARYLNGEPENMIDYPTTRISKAGRVVNICASVSAGCSVRTEQYIKRGEIVVALVTALERVGHSAEVWADLTTNGLTEKDSEGKPCEGTRIRVLVKGSNDLLDVDRLMFALAHPAMMRTLCLIALHEMEAHPDGAKWAETCGLEGYGFGYGTPVKPVEDMARGTVYTQEIVGSSQRNIGEQVRMYLAQLGLVEED